jgi:TonB family protein
MIVVDEAGKAVEVGIISSQPSPEFGLAALEAVKRWHYYPLSDAGGHPILHALRMPLSFRISESFEYRYLSR